jgi:microcystin-dependent protein
MITNIDFIYPIGSIYMTISNISPEVSLGGKWERIKGKCIIGVDEDDSDFVKSGLTGGEKTHQLTLEEMPSHTHKYNAFNKNISTTDVVSGSGIVSRENPYTDNTYGANGGDKAHNNLQPYYTAYIYRRVA